MFRRVLTGLAGLVKFAGRLYDHVAHRADQPQSGRGLQRAVGRPVDAVGQRLKITRVGRLRGHRKRYDPVTCKTQYGNHTSSFVLEMSVDFQKKSYSTQALFVVDFEALGNGGAFPIVFPST